MTIKVISISGLLFYIPFIYTGFNEINITIQHANEGIQLKSDPVSSIMF